MVATTTTNADNTTSTSTAEGQPSGTIALAGSGTSNKLGVCNTGPSQYSSKSVKWECIDVVATTTAAAPVATPTPSTLSAACVVGPPQWLLLLVTAVVSAFWASTRIH